MERIQVPGDGNDDDYWIESAEVAAPTTELSNMTDAKNDSTKLDRAPRVNESPLRSLYRANLEKSKLIADILNVRIFKLPTYILAPSCILTKWHIHKVSTSHLRVRFPVNFEIIYACYC